MTMRTVYRGDALQQSLIMLHKSIADVMMSVVVNNVAGMVVANHIGEQCRLGGTHVGHICSATFNQDGRTAGSAGR